jgi:predicted ATPase/class 3 adenylate cyclase
LCASGALRAKVDPFTYDFPIDTLSFLFTDIEGSTALLRRVGDDAFAEILAEHHEIIRRNLTECDGREEGTMGDSFFATFALPQASVAAALAIQREISQHHWIREEQLHVRMGIHTGEASNSSTGLVGYEVHRAARIAAVGHGGQILLSSASAGLVSDSLTQDVTLRSLGPHRLKDLGLPELLFQLEAPGLKAEFPPLRSLANPELSNNLPTSLSLFVGRVEEVAEVTRLIRDYRLVTLTGAGGSGKTRLALQAAADLLDGSGEGVWFVDLAPISEPGMIPTAITEAMKLRLSVDLAPIDSLIRLLREQNVLLILDNCEHLVAAVSDVVGRISEHCKLVHVVATSRESLGLRGEEVYRVPTLSLPPISVDNVDELEGADAVGLFVARAQSLNRTFVLEDANAGIVAAVCRRLDGIPLAIELAAARLSSMSLADLHERLDQRFRLLTGGSRNALPRQQTLAAMVAWSYDLLSESERVVLRQVSVFVGGFDLEAAEAVCGTEAADAIDVADHIQSLVNKSLVTAEHMTTTLRYRLLETIRQYAEDQLLHIGDEDEADCLRSRHADYFLELCEQGGPLLRAGPSQVEWARRLTVEWDNVMAAVVHFGSREGGETGVMRLCASVSELLMLQGYRDPIPYLEEAMDRAPDSAPGLRARSLFALALMHHFDIGEDDRPRERLLGSLAMFEEVKSLAEQANDEALVTSALTWMAVRNYDVGESATAERCAREALDRSLSLGDSNRIGWSQWVLALSLPSDQKVAMLTAASQSFRTAQNLRGLGAVQEFLPPALLSSGGSYSDARRLLEEAVVVAEELEVSVLRRRLSSLSLYAIYDGDVAAAKRLARRALVLWRRERQSTRHAVVEMFVLGMCAIGEGDYIRAAQLCAVWSEMMIDLPEDHWTWSPWESAFRDRHFGLLQAALGSSELERHQVLSRRMTFGQAVDLALGRSDPQA